MINILAALELLGEAASQESVIQLDKDLELLYPLLAPFKAGTLDFNALAKQRKLKPAVQAFRRTFDMLDKVLDSKFGEEDLGEVLESIPNL